MALVTIGVADTGRLGGGAMVSASGFTAVQSDGACPAPSCMVLRGLRRVRWMERRTGGVRSAELLDLLGGEHDLVAVPLMLHALSELLPKPAGEPPQAHCSGPVIVAPASRVTRSPSVTTRALTRAGGPMRGMSRVLVTGCVSAIAVMGGTLPAHAEDLRFVTPKRVKG